jgi:CP12 domain
MVCMAASSPSTPPSISGKVSETIKQAEDKCAETNPQNRECAAAWDEVQELSTAASHAQDKLKGSDPLENYCKENPQTDEAAPTKTHKLRTNDFESYNVSCIITFSIISCIVYYIESFKIR